jgi:ABC-type lipoprotein export system ATPase subunit
VTTVALEARQLRFAYSSGPSVIEGLDVEILYGSMVALTGPSGRGKSTLLYLLGLLVAPTGGEVLLDGRRTSQLTDAQRARIRARRMGFVFQDAALDPTRPVLDNVIEGSIYRGERRSDAVPAAMAMLERFGVELRADARPGQISGGQASRIALARALLGSPNLVLADEPTGNLDAEASAVVLAALRTAAGGGAAVIVATHDAAARRACDTVVAL